MVGQNKTSSMQNMFVVIEIETRLLLSEVNLILFQILFQLLIENCLIYSISITELEAALILALISVGTRI